jgi:hypothetical protein
MVDGGWRRAVDGADRGGGASVRSVTVTTHLPTSISSDNIKKGGYLGIVYVVCYDRDATYTAKESDQPLAHIC